MRLKWLFFVTLAVFAAAVTAQDYDVEGFWSHEAPEHMLGVNEDDNNDYPFFDLPNEEEAEDKDTVVDTAELFGVKNNADSNEDKSAAGDDYADDDQSSNKEEEILANEDNLSNDSNDSDTVENIDNEEKPAESQDADLLVQEQIKQGIEELDEPESAVADNFDDYQVEDNRSDAKEEVPPQFLVDDDNVQSSSDESGESKDHNDPLEVDPAEGVNLALNYPEFDGNIDNGVLFKEKSLEIDQIIAEANRLLEEENTAFEEDIKDDAGIEKQEDLVLTEAKDIKSHESELDNNNKDLFGDIIENQQNEQIENFSNEKHDHLSLEKLDGNTSEEDVAVEELLQKYKNKEFKYENDMIDPDEAERAENQFNEDIDTSDITDELEEDSKKSEQEDDVKDNPDQDDEDKESSEEEEDTVDKVSQDLNADLEKLFATWDKIISSDSVGDEDAGTLDRDEYEKKYGTPDKEGTVLKEREDFYDTYGIIYDDNHKSSLEGESDSVEYYDVEQNQDDVKESSEDSESKPGNDEANDDSSIQNKSKMKEVAFEITELESNSTKKLPTASKLTVKEEELDIEIYSTNQLPTQVKNIDVDDLTPEQYNDLMTQFKIVHANELNTEDEDFGRNVAAIHLTLSADEVIEITSPNFPATYPTNNVVDWILEGEGTGIELNLTDLDVRGAQADFLLIKPGGLDETGQDGLILSYHLNEPRLYRFTDVNRVFVRFQSGAGLGFLKGFRMTVKMIWPQETLTEEDLPEPEALLPPPPATMTVTLGGVSYYDFKDVKDQFQRIIADMATMYINANGIDAGLNSTSETAQITNTAYCNINWPNFEDCVAVSFGVPLVYEDDEMHRLDENDLVSMWTTYVDRDPFAARLRALGITEFEVPNDGRVMLIWAVLAVGILISAAMLALALWRYSCFEDYTRMKTFGDTDSLREEKRGLDLYPTPHQTLPPLYADNDYKWADAKYNDTTRVDLGGLANNSYAPDELFDIESDEDVVVQRDRNAGFSPRDVYQV